MPPVLDDIEFLESLVDQKPTDQGAQTIVEAIHGRRIMPPGTPLPGLVDVYKTPYLLELMENMSPSSPIKQTTCMKSVQSAMTWFAECVIAAWELYWPTKLLYLTATKEALTKWTKRLEPLLTSVGLRERIVSSNTDRKTRTTGDKALSKTFQGGGALEMGSLQSPSDIASDSIQVAIADEVDRAPELLRSGEGNVLRVLAGRLEAFLWKAKLLVFSTPTTWEASLIYKEFLLGDQREYFVPCKHCGHMFFMKFEHLVPEFDSRGLLITAWLKCPNETCGKKMVNGDKTWMLAPENGAEWQPQAIPSSKYHRSYHISKLMVPVGLATFTNVYQEYLNAQRSGNMASFFNLQLGLPYKEKGHRPKLDVVMELKGAYHSREIPFGVLFLTCCLDVQQGSKTDPNKPPRLEMEILGHGAEFRTWSIEYKVFTGRVWLIDKRTGEMTEIKGGAAEAEKYNGNKNYTVEYDMGIGNPYKGAFSEFHDWALEKFTYTRADGLKFKPRIIFIDSGDPITMSEVYAFCQRPEWKNIFPIKGRGAIRRKAKGESGDSADDNSMIKYRPHRAVDTKEIEFYNISTWHYKGHLFNNLNVKRVPFDPQGPRFCDFPQDYPEVYFKQLTANEKRKDGSFHDIPGQACEALDIRVYGLCAADVWLASRMVWYRKQMLAGQVKRPSQNRRSQLEIDTMIDFKYTLRALENETARRELK